MSGEFNFEENDYKLILDRKYHNELDIECFSLMMKDPSYCYKFYWLEAIVKLISEGVTNTTFNEIIEETKNADEDFEVILVAFDAGTEQLYNQVI